MKLITVVGLFLAASLFTLTGTSLAQQTIVVGTQPDYPPFCYLDEKGVATGYDLELLRKIFDLYP